MTSVLADITEPIPLVLGDSGYPTSVLLSPVFVEGGGRRRRLLARWGFLVAAACLAYLVMLGVSITASPASQPGTAAKPAPRTLGAGGPALPLTGPARAVPPVTPPVEVPVAQALVDGDAAADAPLVLRLALPVTARPALPKLSTTMRAVPTSRPLRDNDSPPATHRPTISTTPDPPSKAASKTSTPKRTAS